MEKKIEKEKNGQRVVFFCSSVPEYCCSAFNRWRLLYPIARSMAVKTRFNQKEWLPPISTFLKQLLLCHMPRSFMHPVATFK